MADATRRESMAACLLAACDDITWTKALVKLRNEDTVTRPAIWRMADAALIHLSYLDMKAPVSASYEQVTIIETRDHLIETNTRVIELQSQVLKLTARLAALEADKRHGT